MLLSDDFIYNKEYERDLFDKIYKSRFWTIRQLWHNAPSKRDFLYLVMFTLPRSIGAFLAPLIIRSFR